MVVVEQLLVPLMGTDPVEMGMDGEEDLIIAARKGSPLAIGLWTVAIVGFILPIVIGGRIKRRMHMSRDEEGSISD